MTKKRRTKQEIAELERKIVILRRSGLTFEEIAGNIGDTASNVGKIFRRSMARVPVASAKELRLLHNQRLEQLYSLAIREANKGSVAAIGKATEVLKQMAELNGYGAPEVVKNEHTGIDGGPIQTESKVTADDLSKLTQEERDALRAMAERRICEEKSVH